MACIIERARGRTVGTVERTKSMGTHLLLLFSSAFLYVGVILRHTALKWGLGAKMASFYPVLMANHEKNIRWPATPAEVFDLTLIGLFWIICLCQAP